jgi:hypothetical protein
MPTALKNREISEGRQSADAGDGETLVLTGRPGRLVAQSAALTSETRDISDFLASPNSMRVLSA